MSLYQRISAHMARHVARQPAMFTFITGVSVLLGSLLIGACLLVVLVFFYGFGTLAFYKLLGPDLITRIAYGAVLLAACGGAGLLAFITGSAMLIAALNHGRYRTAYLWAGAVTGLLATAVFLRIQSY